jgi:DNA-binding LytR/AlgR family response regulator
MVDDHRIVRFEAKSNKTKAILEDNQVILSSETLKYYEKKLHGKAFYRINDKDMINTNYVKFFDYKTRNVTLECGTILTASFRKRRFFFDYMAKQ